jgi:drug/metabolite transporter (DMT)-like permease
MATNERTSPARIVGTILGLVGLLLLVIAMSSHHGGFERVNDSSGDSLVTVIWVLVALACLFGLGGMIGRQRILAIVNTVLAAVIGLLVAGGAVNEDTKASPSFSILLFGCALLAISAVASTLPDTVPAARETVVQEDGRKLVYENDKVVAIEEWEDGKLISTKPFGPK